MSIVWILTPKTDNSDYTNLITRIANHQDVNLKDYDIGQVNNVVITFKDKFIDYVTEKGLNTLINLQTLNEDIVKRGATQTSVVSVMHKYLDKMGIDKELIIVDPYFYSPTTDAQYINTFAQVIDKYLPSIDSLIIVTLANKVDPLVKNAIESMLISKKASLVVTHKTTGEFHDRFWISNSREKGLVTGTSLNGLGKKYALIDRLNTSDVREIVDTLRTLALI